MKKENLYPEVITDIGFLQRDVVRRVFQPAPQLVSVEYNNSTLGKVVEIFQVADNGAMSLKTIWPADMQSVEDLEIAKDYYNGFLLGGHETYLDYYSSEGKVFFLQSRNIRTVDESVFPS